VQPRNSSPSFAKWPHAFIGHLAGSFAATLIDREPGDRCNAILGRFERRLSGGQASSHGADNARCGDGDPRSSVESVKSQFVGFLAPAIPVAFSIEALYKCAPRTETEAWKLVDCPVEFIQWRFEIR
jgi:hypothetical protein